MTLKNYEINRISWISTTLSWLYYPMAYLCYLINETYAMYIFIGIGMVCSTVGTLGFVYLLTNRKVKPRWMCVDRNCTAHKEFQNGIPEKSRLSILPEWAKDGPIYKCPKCRDELVPYETCRKIGF